MAHVPRLQDRARINLFPPQSHFTLTGGKGACAGAADAQTVQDPAGTGRKCHLGAAFQPMSAALSPSCQLQAQSSFLAAAASAAAANEILQIKRCRCTIKGCLFEAYCTYPGQPGLSLRGCALRLEQNSQQFRHDRPRVTVVRQSEGGNPHPPLAAE